jgi:hypothetical protein
MLTCLTEARQPTQTELNVKNPDGGQLVSESVLFMFCDA